MADELPHVVWDDENLRHLLVERAHREISCQEVEDVLQDSQTTKEAARAGRRLAIGRTKAGRPLAVVFVGELEARPHTAWQVSEARWRRAHGETGE